MIRTAVGSAPLVPRGEDVHVNRPRLGPRSGRAPRSWSRSARRARARRPRARAPVRRASCAPSTPTIPSSPSPGSCTTSPTSCIPTTTPTTTGAARRSSSRSSAPRVARLVGAHVVAKRYLVTTDPAYRDRPQPAERGDAGRTRRRARRRRPRRRSPPIPTSRRSSTCAAPTSAPRIPWLGCPVSSRGARCSPRWRGEGLGLVRRCGRVLRPHSVRAFGRAQHRALGAAHHRSSAGAARPRPSSHAAAFTSGLGVRSPLSAAAATKPRRPLASPRHERAVRRHRGRWRAQRPRRRRPARQAGRTRHRARAPRHRRRRGDDRATVGTRRSR